MSTSQIESSSGYDERPFAVVVTERKHELGLSYSVLSARTKAMDRDGRGLSPAYLVRLFNGYEDPVARAICLIAGALESSPRTSSSTTCTSLERSSTNTSIVTVPFNR